MINKRSTTPKKAAQSLRRRAEKILKGQKKMPTAPSPKDMKRLFHELETHQVELEIQNQGLREAQTEVEASRRKYAELYHFAPVGYFTLDKNGIILEVNVTGAAMLGVSNRLLAGKPFSHFIVDIKDRKAFASHRDKVLRHGIKNACELKLGSLEAASFHARLESIPTEDSEGELTLIRTTVSDITERKKTE
ncbi:MAG TPA: PAS domain-containing protein, partial [Thermodesulfovibrionales bacterium]|nr:PAS domain-containing protein [Thermodesulfovibrionales bacterium]